LTALAEAEATAVDLVLEALVLVALAEAEEEVDTLVKDELLDLLLVAFGFGAEVEFLVEADLGAELDFLVEAEFSCWEEELEEDGLTFVELLVALLEETECPWLCLAEVDLLVVDTLVELLTEEGLGSQVMQ